MSRFLLLDIGAGTLDILYADTEADAQYKAVVKSPVRYLAEQAESLPGNLAVTGCEMGGGQVSAILKERTRTAEVVMSLSAAATVHHNLDRVRSVGIQIVPDAEAAALQEDSNYSALHLADVDIKRVRTLVEGFGVPFEFDYVGICAQDHGVAPASMSHLDYRHNLFRAALDENPHPHELLHPAGEVPATMNRLTAIAKSAEALPAREVYVMDSGMAAILGASMDPLRRGKEKILVLDVATSHTVGAALIGDEIAGFFEYHTVDITLEKLEALLQALAEGKLTHQQVLSEGGHGAYIRQPIGYADAEIILATGPKRKLVADSRLPIVFGAPGGDNMMTGTVGLLEAIRRRKGLDPILHI